jgi:uncharacterized protein YraI/peptidoglycan/xylan/chitin deacetylase (PgdA/CDA1 family)
MDVHRPALRTNGSPVLRIGLVSLFLLTTLVAALYLPQPVAAQQMATTTANLRLRVGPSTGSDTIVVMPFGARVEITGAQIDGFYPVAYQDTPGYAYGAYLDFDAPDVSEGQAVTIDVALHLRAGPSTSFASLAVMPAGAQAILTGQVNGAFYELTYNGMIGWSHSDYFTLVAEPPQPSPTNTPVGPSPTPTATPTPTNTPNPANTPTNTPLATATMPPTATVTTALNLRTGAGTNFPVITIMPAGATVQLLGETNSGFARVQYATYEGWAYASYLDMPSAPDNSARTTARLNLRSGPSTGSPVLLVMPSGATVTLTGGIQNGYMPITYQGTAGWAFASYLSGSQVPLPDGPTQVNILLYHRIRSTPGDYQVTAAQLEQQMSWLKSNGYESITPRDLLAYMNEGADLPIKPVMITIDDGNASDRQFKEILDRYGFEGVWFMPNYMALSAAELREFHADGEVCGHTVTHPYLWLMSYSGQWAEIYNNKVWLENQLGEPITCFSYPFGGFNATTIQVVQDAGFQIAFDAWGGSQVLSPTMDRWHIYRWNVYGHYTISDLAAFMS